MNLLLVVIILLYSQRKAGWVHSSIRAAVDADSISFVIIRARLQVQLRAETGTAAIIRQTLVKHSSVTSTDRDN